MSHPCCVASGYFEAKIKLKCQTTVAVSSAFQTVLEWVEATSQLPSKTALEDGSSDDMKILMQVTAYAEKFFDSFSVATKAACAPDAATGTVFADIAGSLGAFLKAVTIMLKKLKFACSARGLMALSNQELKELNYKDVLPAKMHSVAHALQLDWPAETKALEAGTGNLTAIFGKLDIAEAASAASHASSLKDEVFTEVRNMATTYANTFNDLLVNVVTKEGMTRMEPLQKFFDKYQDIERCIEASKFDEVDWMYQDEMTKEVKADFAGLKEARRGAEGFIATLDDILGKAEHFGKITQCAKDVRSHVEEKIAISSRAGCQMLFNELVYCSDGSRALVKELEKTTRKHYTFGEEDMPEKLKAKLAQLPETGPNDPKSKEKVHQDKDKGDDKSRPAEKENTKEKEKKEKDKDKSKDKSKDKDKSKEKEKKLKRHEFSEGPKHKKSKTR